jgi:hypothetical protein
MFFLLVILISANAFSPIVLAENSEPTLTKGTVTPRKSYPNIDYLFTVTYTDANNDAASSVTVFIDGVEYEMEGVDPTDTNYTDGKDYSFKKVMSEGSYSIYYTADDGNGSVVNTNAFTLSVTWDVGHFDIIHFIEEGVVPGLVLLLGIIFALVLILCVISIFMVLQLRKIAKGLEGLKGDGNGQIGADVLDESQTQ